MTAVIGLDLSLARSAACYIPEGWELGKWSQLRAASWPTKALKDQGSAEEHERAYWLRITGIVEEVSGFVLERRDRARADGVGLRVFAEGYAFAIHSSAVTKLAELRGALCVNLLRQGIVVVPANITSARNLLLGKIPRPKKGEPKLPKGYVKTLVQQKLYAVGATFANDDECDSLAVANLGLSETGAMALTLA